MVLPWHAKTVKHLPEEQLITDTLKTVITEPGFYVFPHGTNQEGKVDQKLWAEKYRRGPVGNLIFSPNGTEPMGFTHFLFGRRAQSYTTWFGSHVSPLKVYWSLVELIDAAT
jgi:hypothetical protein